MTPSLLIVTMALRPDGALRAAQSVAAAPPGPWPMEHRILWHHGPQGWATFAARITADVFSAPPPGAWIMFVDDDNLLHPALPTRLAEVVTANPGASMVLFDQRRRDFGGLLPARPPQVGFIDGGQAAFFAEAVRGRMWPPGPTGDGLLLGALYAEAPGSFVFVDEPLTYHNAQRWMPG